MSRLIAGSAKAIAWGKKMQKIRAAGARTERKFFGPRGIFAKAGHVKHISVSRNPKELKFKQWVEKVYGMRWSLYLDLPRNQKDKVQSNYLAWERKQLKQNPITLTKHLMNPKGIKVYYAGVFIDGKQERSDGFRTSKEARAWIQRLKDEGFNVKMPGVYSETIARPKTIRRTRTQRNPITLNGNPPSEIHTKVAGILYNRCLEIRAEKTTAKGLKGLYYHPFQERSQVCILALTNGDLLIHSKVGEQLWKLD